MIIRTLLPVLGFAVMGERALAEEHSPTQLIDVLRDGGHSLYFRHAATEWSQSDTVVNASDWKSCDPGKMRLLSDPGRDTAT